MRLALDRPLCLRYRNLPNDGGLRNGGWGVVRDAGVIKASHRRRFTRRVLKWFGLHGRAKARKCREAGH
jgi:hypothetical protein